MVADARWGGRHGKGRDHAERLASLSSVDLRLLQIVPEHRVVTQTQLELLVEDVPARTLRYRTARLHRLGLIGRTRPYRERGSAPYHLWPTRRRDALARGAPPPRGGERREPNPTFIAHAAALTDFYVALVSRLPAGIELASFVREGEAREAFRSIDGRRRAIAPDARIEFEDEGGRRLIGLLEVDLGTMSHRRLRAKARGYADYARAGAWRERHEFCPALVFATVAERRALAFLTALEQELEDGSELRACACGLVREPGRAVAEPIWRLLGGTEAVELIEALREARRPYDEERVRVEELRRRQQAERERLRSDPAALRAHLRRERRGLPERLDDPVATALELLLEGEAELAEVERGALGALAGMLADPLVIRWAEREPDAGEREALDQLADYYRSRQRQEVERVAGRLGEGPALRRARRRLEAGELLSLLDLNWLAKDAERDHEARAEQERLRVAYLERRQREARWLAKDQGLAGRLRRRPESFLTEVDRRLLRVCRDCEETAYPHADEPTASGTAGDVARRCHFCGRGGLEHLADGADTGVEGERARA
jgi:hypothetical protein